MQNGQKHFVLDYFGTSCIKELKEFKSVNFQISYSKMFKAKVVTGRNSQYEQILKFVSRKKRERIRVNFESLFP